MLVIFQTTFSHFSSTWDVEPLAWFKLNKTVRPWHRIISVQLLHNSYVICFVSERYLHLAIVPADRRDDTSGRSTTSRRCDCRDVQSGSHVTVVHLLELKSADETVRFSTTSTSAIVFAKGKMNIFDFFDF